jgi:hypothetical protein
MCHLSVDHTYRPNDDSYSDGLFLVSFNLFCLYVIVTVIPIDYFICPSSFEGNHFVIRELMHGICEADDYMSIFMNNRALPPVIGARMTAGHWETREIEVTTTDRDGQSHTSTIVVLYFVLTLSLREDLRYGSWKDETTEIDFPTDALIIHTSFRDEYCLDHEASCAFQRLIEKLRMIGYSVDSDVTVTPYYTVPRFTSVVSGTFQKIPKWLKSYTSFSGKLLWVLSVLVGYQSAYEAFWCSHGVRFTVKVPKLVSLGCALPNAIDPRCGTSIG